MVIACAPCAPPCVPYPILLTPRPVMQGVAVMQGMAEHLDVPVSSVVAAIDRAVTVPHPYARYSLDASVTAFIFLRTRVLSDWLWDMLWPTFEALQTAMIWVAAAAKTRKESKSK